MSFKVNQPKVSANKLGEYIESSPARRLKIVHDQKYPKGYIVTRYNDARKAIIDFFTNGKGDKDVIKRKIESLILKTYSSTFRNQDNALSIKALEIFLDSNISLDTSRLSVTRFNDDLNKLNIEGVSVSIEPEVMITGSYKGKEFIGAIKIHISKTNHLNDQSGKYVATLLHTFLEKNYPEKIVKPNFCISLDIFTGRYFIAPQSYKIIRKELEAACYEYKLHWNNS